MNPLILPIKPNSLSKADKAALQKAGVIVIEHENPESIRLLKPNSELSASDLLIAAMRGVMANDGRARLVFAENCLKFLEEARKARQTDLRDYQCQECGEHLTVPNRMGMSLQPFEKWCAKCQSVKTIKSSANEH